MCNMTMKIFIVFLLLSLVKAASKYYDGPIRPYEFGYNIEGHQHRKESKDKNGIVMGEFGFITADNVYHVTVYATDENGNFKIVSMKNYKLGPTAPPTTTSTTTTTTSATTTAYSPRSDLPTPKPSGLAACSGCRIPEEPTTAATNPPKPVTEPTLPETSTQYVPPFKIVNKNEIESVPSTPKPTSNAIPVETPQKLVEKTRQQQDSKAPGSKESTNTAKPPDGMQVDSNKPSPSTIPSRPLSSSTKQDGGGGRGEPGGGGFDGASKLPTVKASKSTTPSSPAGVHTANMMIQHILNGLLYRFNYTVGYHGHHEEGDRKGNKDGGYFSVGRDGIRREVSYKANEFGFQPHIKFEKVSPEETPREETEKQAGLKGFDFKWFWGKS